MPASLAATIVLTFGLGPVAFADTPTAQVDANLSSAMPCAALAGADFSHIPDAPSTITSASVVAASG
ncbi:MAG TPA: hypothetical protein VMU37_05295, partial [Caulobacteraceae bacterium]|nr:hypothetical protein [Caulobacteraceae bacterium]